MKDKTNLDMELVEKKKKMKMQRTLIEYIWVEHLLPKYKLDWPWLL